MGKKIVKIKKDIHYVSENEVERLMQKLMSENPTTLKILSK